jgi:cytochrome c oxidase subunit 3
MISLFKRFLGANAWSGATGEGHHQSWVEAQHPKRHHFHLVDPSPWPLAASLSALVFVLGLVKAMHFYEGSSSLLILGFTSLLLTANLWWRDVIEEGTFDGRHTRPVQASLRLGFVLFIVSEVMFFFGFFWAFFHSSLAPAVEIGSIWPPAGIQPFDPWGVPLLNTFILLLSGVTVTASHHYLLSGNYDRMVLFLGLTILLGLIFTAFQAMEYLGSTFTISDSVYGTTFFMITGFHGFHVIIGTLFLTVCLVRQFFHHFTREHHLGFEFAVWYWHFVDVVWLFVFASIYWWGSL